MDLTRRQTVAAVLAGGFGTSAVLQSLPADDRSADPRDEIEITDAETRSLTALADVVYPSAVSEPAPLVERYLRYQPPDSKRAIRESIATLDRQARRRYGGPFAALAPGERERLLRDLGVDRMAPDSDGTVPARIRHTLVNGLLYALFTDPAGSQLVGIENPRGYPGGYASYAKPPDGDRR